MRYRVLQGAARHCVDSSVASMTPQGLGQRHAADVYLDSELLGEGQLGLHPIVTLAAELSVPESSTMLPGMS